MNAPKDIRSLIQWPEKVNEIPKEVFNSEEVFKLELERIFYGPEWHIVAHQGEIPLPGDYKTFRLGEMPLLIVQGEDGEIRVFENSCSHRGNLLVVKNCGNSLEFECPYHRWIFDGKGALRGAPLMNDFAPSFKKENFGLKALRTENFHGMIFTTLSDKAPDLDTFLGAVKEPLMQAMSGGDLKLLGYQKIKYDCNWKAYFDNDGYHAPLLHSAFKLLNWQGGAGRQFATERGHIGFVSDLVVPDPSKQNLVKDGSLIEFKGKDSSGSVIAGIRPLSGITKHLDMINIRFAIAKGVAETEVHYAYFCRVDDDDEMMRHRVRQSSNMLGPSGLVSMEDASIFLRIHQGSRTSGNAIFQKGVHDEQNVAFEFQQNDEAGNLPGWEYYRKVMGFQRVVSS